MRVLAIVVIDQTTQEGAGRAGSGLTRQAAC